MRLILDNLVYETENAIKIERLMSLGAKELVEDEGKTSPKKKANNANKKEDGDGSRSVSYTHL